MFRVFKENVAWSDVIFIIDNRISFKSIKNNPQTSMLRQESYIGMFDFDEKILNMFDYKELSGYKYYFLHCYEKDD